MRAVQKLVTFLLLMLLPWQLAYAAGRPHVEPGGHCARFERYYQQIACATKAHEQGRATQAADAHLECGPCWVASLPATALDRLPAPPAARAALHDHIEPYFSDAIPHEPDRPDWAA
ncbi:hypothetical protein [Chitinimonas koreensis]|uniref:hypothetical protein n=1 Tax=Chitinimonas koreensis TaxID=356302 RepID=UPI0003FFDB04|nr:hypothetical protein [Chitinimonas koreensis]QNM95303.1 hypothetical protein H9L41_15655 [Chitinimonas koreensis]